MIHSTTQIPLMSIGSRIYDAQNANK